MEGHRMIQQCYCYRMVGYFKRWKYYVKSSFILFFLHLVSFVCSRLCVVVKVSFLILIVIEVDSGRRFRFHMRQGWKFSLIILFAHVIIFSIVFPAVRTRNFICDFDKTKECSFRNYQQYQNVFNSYFIIITQRWMNTKVKAMNSINVVY